MWISLRNSVVRWVALVAKGIAWWIEMMGKNPALSRDLGILTWRELSRKSAPAPHTERQLEEAELPAGELRPRSRRGFLPAERVRRMLGPQRPLHLLEVRVRHHRWRDIGHGHRTVFLSR